ncbi:hypothetical protein ACFO9Q_08215 [Paenibacillus sp. GCM10023252]|uniref:hypothetical protein n=1 Tax=Paenibacillus sp. GCM10023252 TaxID=3252649 RepID=UPI00361F687E
MVVLLLVIQVLLGYLFIAVGIWLAIVGGIGPGVLLIAGGISMIILSWIFDMVKDMYDDRLGLPMKASRLMRLQRSAMKVVVRSDSFQPYPEGDREYPLLILDGEMYLRAKVFLNGLSQEKSTYTFQFPGQEPLVLECSPSYRKGVDLFEAGEYVFVRLAALPYKTSLYKNELTFTPI